MSAITFFFPAWLFLFAVAAIPSAGQSPSPPANWPAPPPLESPPAGKTRNLPSSEIQALLEQLEKRYGGLKSLQAEFEQVRIAEDFDLEKRSSGKLFLKMPDKLRCEYEDRTHPSIALFAGNTFYLHTPSLKQVDKYKYESPQDAQAFFKTLLLGFGVSSREILESHEVEMAPAEPGMEEREVFGLAFKPLREDIRADVSEIRVWFGKSDSLPQKVRVWKAGGEELTLEVKKVLLDPPNMPESLFESVFPKGTDIIER